MLSKVETHSLIQWDRREVLFAQGAREIVGGLVPQWKVAVKGHCLCSMGLLSAS